MTTSVIIGSPTPNHQNVGIFVQYFGADGKQVGELVPVCELTAGQLAPSNTLYLTSGMRLVLIEMPYVAESATPAASDPADPPLKSDRQISGEPDPGTLAA